MKKEDISGAIAEPLDEDAGHTQGEFNQDAEDGLNPDLRLDDDYFSSALAVGDLKTVSNILNMVDYLSKPSCRLLGELMAGVPDKVLIYHFPYRLVTARWHPHRQRKNIFDKYKEDSLVRAVESLVNKGMGIGQAIAIVAKNSKLSTKSIQRFRAKHKHIRRRSHASSANK